MKKKKLYKTKSVELKHDIIPGTQEAEARRLQVQGQLV